jgi:hypothetical protein
MGSIVFTSHDFENKALKIFVRVVIRVSSFRCLQVLESTFECTNRFFVEGQFRYALPRCYNDTSRKNDLKKEEGL